MVRRRGEEEEEAGGVSRLDLPSRASERAREGRWTGLMAHVREREEEG